MGVRFTHMEDHAAAVALSGSAPLGERLRALGVDRREALARALERGDDRQALDLAGQVREHDAALADTLESMIREMQLEELPAAVPRSVEEARPSA